MRKEKGDEVGGARRDVIVRRVDREVEENCCGFEVPMTRRSRLIVAAGLLHYNLSVGQIT